MDVGGVQRPEAPNLRGRLGEREGRESKKIRSIRAYLDVGQFEKEVIKRVLEHGEIGSGSIGDRVGKAKGD
jgi:hypothetical protein